MATIKCQIPRCGRRAVYKAHQLCATHYQRYRRGLPVNVRITRARRLPIYGQGGAA